MISVKLKFRPSIVAGKEGSLYFQVIYNRIVRQVPTRYKIVSEEWDAENNIVIIQSDDNKRNKYLQSMRQMIQWDRRRLFEIISKCISAGSEFSVDHVIDEFNKGVNYKTLFLYMQDLIEKLSQNGQVRTSETYSSTLNSFKRFRRGIDLHFVEIDEDLLLSYEHFLKNSDLSMNTISFYLKRLRAVYNRAISEGIIDSNNPFKKVYTSTGKTVKRAISLESIRKLKELDLSFSKSKNFARDMFLFSFYTRGMSFVDMAYLKKKDLSNGILSYRRRKTGQQLFVHWEPCMQKILERYPASSDSPYLLDIISTNDETKSRSQYRNAQTVINRNLKDVGRLIGLGAILSMYVARHSWASIARNEGISVSVISEGMGHDSEMTTRIYLASLDMSLIDNANQKIIGLL